MTRRRLFLPLLLPLLSACNSDNVSWAFVSNTTGTFGATGGAVIIIRFTSSSTAGQEGDFLRVEGADARGPVSVLLPYRGDFGVLQHSGSVEVRSTALSFEDGGHRRPGRFEAADASVEIPPSGGPAVLRVRLPDTSVVHPGGVGPGTLHIARAGTLMILESGAGLVVFGERSTPEVVGTSATLTTTPAGDRFALRRSDNSLRILEIPALPRPEQRLVHVPRHDSLRILGPVAEALAELPADTVTLRNGESGVFLQAALPDGLPGDPGRMNLLMAADNRYLLRING